MNRDLEALKEGLLRGERAALARGLTLVESTLERDRTMSNQLLEALWPSSGKAIRLGISGPPGVGKSTLIGALGPYLTSLGHKVAVLAVDPSGPFGGSVMGDKTRMLDLLRDPSAFIRPSPSSGAHGGVSRKTREAILLCEAAGYDLVLIETMGVGQSEYVVHSMVDFFLVLLSPYGGDDLQGIKKGLFDRVDALAVNKADGELKQAALDTVTQYKRALHLTLNRSQDFWTPPVLSCSAIEKKGSEEIWNTVEKFIRSAKANGEFSKRRDRQNEAWCLELLREIVDRKIHHFQTGSVYKQGMRECFSGKKRPWISAREMSDHLLKS